MTEEKVANEKELASLHSILAKVLAAQIGQEVEEYADDDIDEEGVVREGAEPVRVYVATPALLTVAARFLKDNDITCEVDKSKGVSELKDKLAKRKKRPLTAKILPLSRDEEDNLGVG